MADKRVWCGVCEASCGLIATVRDGKILQLRPDKEHPQSRGFACPKGINFPDVLNDPDRLREPVRRNADGTFTPVGWDEALDDIGARLRSVIRTHGRESIGVGLGNPNAAKQVVAHYVNDLALQLAPANIRVNAIHPTNVNTDMLHSPPMYSAFRPDLKEPTRADAELAFPVMNGMPTPYIEPEDVSEVVLFLASDVARYVTGQQLRVDAGGALKVRPWSGP